MKSFNIRKTTVNPVSLFGLRNGFTALRKFQSSLLVAFILIAPQVLAQSGRFSDLSVPDPVTPASVPTPQSAFSYDAANSVITISGNLKGRTIHGRPSQSRP